MMRSGNPALNDATFQTGVASPSESMTLEGTVNKCILCLVLLMVPAAYVWNQVLPSSGLMDATTVSPPYGLMVGGAIVGFVLSLVTIFKKTWAPYTVPLYSVAEGLFLGGISAVFELQFPGIVIQAVGLTMLVFLALLLAYRSGMIKATENFKLGITAATGGICLLYLVGFILGFFGVQIPYIHDSGPIGIGFSLVVVTIAALNLVMDFDFIESGAASNAPKYMEWYAVFGLLVTLIWLYLELLRLLAKIQSRD